MKTFEGVYPAMVTPLNEDLTIDEKGLRLEVDFLIEGGVHGLVPLGSTGEFPYIPMDEKKRVIDVVVEQANRRVPVVAGTSAMGTEDVIELSRYARDRGADGVMINIPVYYPLTDDDVFNHYQAVAKAVDLPIMLYDFPGVTHWEMSPELISRLSNIESIVGIKETAGLDKVEQVIKIEKKEPFNTFTGVSFIFLEALKLGAAGVICLLPNIAPRDVSSIYESFKAGDIEKASQLQAKLLPLVSLVALPVQSPVVKEAMRLLGLDIKPCVKMPLPQITTEQQEMVKKTLTDLGML